LFLLFVDLQPEQPSWGHLDTDKPVVPCRVKHRQPASSDLMLSSAARGEPSRLGRLGASDGEALGGQEGKDPHTFVKVLGQVRSLSS
jgi:hypothetical protein